MTTINTNVNASAPSFIELGKSIGKPMESVHAGTRAAKFDAVFNNYVVNGDVAEYTEKDGTVRKFSFIETLLAIPRPELLPEGSGRVDKVIDGASDTPKKDKSAPVTYLLSAEEYRANVINNTLVKPAYIYNRLSKLAADSSVTKAMLLEAINDIIENIFPAEQVTVYENMLKDEQETENLKAFGVEFPANNAIFVKDNVKYYNATITSENYLKNSQTLHSLINISEPLQFTIENGQLVAKFTFTLAEK